MVYCMALRHLLVVCLEHDFVYDYDMSDEQSRRLKISWRDTAITAARPSQVIVVPYVTADCPRSYLHLQEVFEAT